jgi:hypothetical protein
LRAHGARQTRQPRCKYPVGLGAKRVISGVASMASAG